METPFKCPSCQRPLASRRHKYCQYCGAELPEALLLTSEQIEYDNHQWAKEQAERRKRQEEKDREEIQNSGDFIMPPLG